MSANYLNIPPYAALRCILADGVSAEPRGRVQGSAILPQLVLSSMRTVAAVVALVACVHAGLWALMRDNVRAPNFDGQLASVSYAPFEGSVHPDAGGKARGRTNSRRSQDAGAGDSRNSHILRDRRRGTRAGHRIRVRIARYGRCLDRQKSGSQRARNSFGDRSRQAAQQHQRRHRRQRNDLPRRTKSQTISYR